MHLVIKNGTVSLTRICGPDVLINCRVLVKVLLWLFYFVIVVSFVVQWTTSFKELWGESEKEAEKMFQVNILKNRMVTNIENWPERPLWHATGIAWGGKTGFTFVSKVNRTRIPQWKCHGGCVGGMLVWRRVHAQPVGGSCDYRGLHRRPVNYINQGRFRPKQRRAEKEEVWKKSHKTLRRSGLWLYARLPRAER